MTRVFVNGDSWTFGSDILAPELVGRAKDYSAENDSYRIPRIWPTLLAAELGAELVNASYPARSNDVISRTTTEWLFTNYLAPKRSTDDLLIVIGWSSPERKNILFQDLDGREMEYIFWPMMAETKFYDHHLVKKHFEFYVNHLWVQREILTRYIEQNLALHNLCALHGIKHYFFNAFWEPSAEAGNFRERGHLNVSDALAGLSTNIGGWADAIYSWNQENQRLRLMWESIPPSVFIGKDSGLTFKSYVDDTLPPHQRWNDWHPSPLAHAEWATYLASFIKRTP